MRRTPPGCRIGVEPSKGLASYQTRDGFWHQLIDSPDTYQETSATAVYICVIARAVNRGYVDARMYGPMASLAWNAVASKVTARGQIEGVCVCVGTGMAFDPALHSCRPTSVEAAHCYGPTLLAGAEVIEISKKFKFGRNDSGWMYQGARP